MKSILGTFSLLLLLSCNNGSKSTASKASSPPQKAELKTALATSSASDQCTQKGSGWSWDATTQVCNQVLTTVSATQQCTALGTSWTWDPAQNACVVSFTSLSAKVQCEKNAGMKWSVADNACEQSYSTRLAQDECTAQRNLNGGSFVFAASTDSTGATQYLCYEYASTDAVDTKSTTQTACTTAHKNDDTWVFAGGKCFQFAKQETGSQYCADKGTGWTLLSNGVCAQAAILTADQCTAKNNTNINVMWDVSTNQCIQYITLDTTQADGISCTGNHANDPNTTWIWITTAKSPVAGVCAETLQLNTTKAQCDALGSTNWQYDTSTTPPRCKQIMAQYSSISQCAAAEAAAGKGSYTWNDSTQKCVQNVTWDSSQWVVVKTQCTSIPGYYWIPTSAGSLTDLSGVCKPASALSDPTQCAAFSTKSTYYNTAVTLAWNNNLGMCVTQGMGEEICRMTGRYVNTLSACTSNTPASYCDPSKSPWNYTTMSCQFCPTGQDLVEWAVDGTPVCKSPPYVSVALGYFHGCAKVRAIGDTPNVQCWGGIWASTGAPPLTPDGETVPDVNEGRTLRTELTKKDSKSSGHLAPDRRDAIPFQQTLSNHVRSSSPIVSVAVGAYATCAIVDNTLQCWGRSDFVGGNPDGTPTPQWLKEVRDLTPANPNLRLKKVVASKTDAGLKIGVAPIMQSSSQGWTGVTSEKDKEIFCLLADDYSALSASQPAQSAVYCWGVPISSAILANNTNTQNSPFLLPMASTVTTSAPIKTGVYSDIYVTQSHGCLVPQDPTKGPVCWGTEALTPPPISTSFSTSGLLSCYLDSTSPKCYGTQGYESGNWLGVSQSSYATPLWDPTPLLGTNTLTNAFVYDVPENPETMALTSPLVTGAIMTGQMVGVNYTQVTTQTKTTGSFSTPSTPVYVSPRSIPSQAGPPTTTKPTFKKVVTMKANACGIDTNGNVWCWGFCQTYNYNNGAGAGNFRMSTGGPSPYCRTNPTDGTTLGIDTPASSSNYAYSLGRYTPTKVAWMAFLSDRGDAAAIMITPYRKILAIPPKSANSASQATSKLLDSTPPPTPYLDHVIDLYPGVYSICALRDMDWNPGTNASSGTNPYEVFCWGYDGLGNLGNGTGDSSGEGTLSAGAGSFTSPGITGTTTVTPSVNPTVTSVANGTLSTVYANGATTSSVANGTTTTTQTNVSVYTGTLPAPVLTATPGSFIGAPTFSLPKIQ